MHSRLADRATPCFASNPRRPSNVAAAASWPTVRASHDARGPQVSTDDVNADVDAASTSSHGEQGNAAADMGADDSSDAAEQQDRADVAPSAASARGEQAQGAAAGSAQGDQPAGEETVLARSSRSNSGDASTSSPPTRSQRTARRRASSSTPHARSTRQSRTARSAADISKNGAGAADISKNGGRQDATQPVAQARGRTPMDSMDAFLEEEIDRRLAQIIDDNGSADGEQPAMGVTRGNGGTDDRASSERGASTSGGDGAQKAGTKENMRLHMQLFRETNLGTISEIVAEQGAVFDNFNLIIALKRIADLVPGLSHEEHRELLTGPTMPQLARAVEDCIDKLDAMELTLTLWAFARIGYAPQSYLPKLAVRLRDPKISSKMSPKCLANCVWGFGKLRHRNDQTLSVITGVCEARISELSPQGLSNIAWGVARLGYDAPTLMDAIADAASGPLLSQMSPQGIANTLWAFATLRYEPSREAHAALLGEAEARYDEFAPQGIANVVWAMSSFDRVALPPRSELLQRVSATTLQYSMEFSPCDMNMLLVAYARMRAGRRDVIAAMVQRVASNLGAYGTKEITGVLWALGELKYNDRAFLRAALPRVLRRLRGLQPLEVSNLLWALSKLRYTLPEDTAWELVQVVESRASGMSPKQLSSSASALADMRTLDPALQRRSVLALAQTAKARLHTFRPAEVGNLVHALGRARLRPNAVLQAILIYYKTADASTNGTDVSMLMWFCGTMGYNPPNRFMRGIFMRASDDIDAGKWTPRDVATTMWALSKMRKAPPAMLLRAVNKFCVAHSGRFNAADLSQLLCALGRMSLPLGELALAALARRSSELRDNMSHHQLANASWGFAILRYHPGTLIGRARTVLKNDFKSLTRSEFRSLHYAHTAFNQLSNSASDSTDSASSIERRVRYVYRDRSPPKPKVLPLADDNVDGDEFEQIEPLHNPSAERQ